MRANHDQPYRLGDVVHLKKRHPCGSQGWVVVRLGADIGLRCLGCQRRVLLSRLALARQLRAVEPAEADGATPIEGGTGT
jgi:hypothetical protein